MGVVQVLWVPGQVLGTGKGFGALDMLRLTEIS